MLYPDARSWTHATEKHVLLFGMSGLGKTTLSNMLRASGRWFHYSVDYRIGTRYMGEAIEDNCKREAMKNPFLRELLMTDSINIASNLTFNNLAPLSTYLGKPGDPAKGGLPFDEYMRRQRMHREAEIAAMLDTPAFIDRARTLYGYPHFVCDTSGSICEVVDPDDRDDPVLTVLADNLLLVWIEGTEAHAEELIRRSIAHPKPMYYQPDFLETCWSEYLESHGCTAETADPDGFLRSTYARALAHRRPIYARIARNWGVTVAAEDVARVANPDDFDALIARAIDMR